VGQKDSSSDRFDEVKLVFEGVSVTEQRVTLAAFALVPKRPLKQFEEFEFRGRARVLDVGHKGDPKERTAQRKHLAQVLEGEITQVIPR
jgi:hypothetical protein